MIRISVLGAEGRMGRLITQLIEETSDTELCALFTEPGHEKTAGVFHPQLPLSGSVDIAKVHPVGGVIIDFSLAPSLETLINGAEQTQSPLVIGTTGHNQQQISRLRDYATRYPVVLASNFSIGIPALRLLLEKLADILPSEFLAEEVEIHHRHKLDKPSGTALTLAQAWRASRGGETVPIHSLRIGGITGEHKWVFSDEDETLEITHRAHSRRAFLKGVLPAARFAASAAPGLYGMEDVLSV